MELFFVKKILESLNQTRQCHDTKQTKHTATAEDTARKAPWWCILLNGWWSCERRSEVGRREECRQESAREEVFLEEVQL